jgi:hypothetical protein
MSNYLYSINEFDYYKFKQIENFFDYYVKIYITYNLISLLDFIIDLRIIFKY